MDWLPTVLLVHAELLRVTQSLVSTATPPPTLALQGANVPITTVRLSTRSTALVVRLLATRPTECTATPLPTDARPLASVKTTMERL